MSIPKITDILSQAKDGASSALGVIDYSHHEVHEGSAFYVMYSVLSLGAMTTPDDTITLTLVTPNTTKWSHFTFSVNGSAGWRVRLIEAPTGGAASATGTIDILNHNRNYQITKPSTVGNGTTTGVVSYDATLATGGVTLWDQYLEGSGGPQAGGTGTGKRNEIILKSNTTYQLSLYGTDTNPATMYIDWYENTNKG